jgi:hypothetical protein
MPLASAAAERPMMRRLWEFGVKHPTNTIVVLAVAGSILLVLVSAMLSLKT